MNAYASGRHALGICDRCGLTYKLTELKDEVRNGFNRGVRVCSDCWDDDHPQLWLGRMEFPDPQSLLNPRPDRDLAASRAITYSQKVVSAPLALELGNVMVTVV